MIKLLLCSSLFLVGAMANAADEIPKNAKVCVLEITYAEDVLIVSGHQFSCDGSVVKGLAHVSAEGVDKGGIQELSGQLYKFSKLGYVIKSSANNSSFVFTK